MRRYIFAIFLIYLSLFSFAQSPEWVWSKNTTGYSNAYGRSVITDNAGYVYYTGAFRVSSVNFDDTVINNAGGATGYDLFVAKYDSIGNLIWVKSFGGIGSEESYGIAVDNNCNIFITGMYRNTTFDLGGNILTNPDGGPNAWSKSNIFLAKLDSSGNVIWAKGFGGTDNDEAYCLTTDEIGNIYLAGTFLTAISFDGITLNNAGSNNPVFAAKFDNSGNAVWADKATVTGPINEAFGISSDNNGFIYVTGDYRGNSITFGSYTLINPVPSDPEIFVVKYDVNGNVTWAKTAAGSDFDKSCGVASDFNHNVYIVGWFQSSSMDFNGIIINNPSPGYNRIFLAKYDASGNEMWAKSLGSDDNDYGYGIASDIDGNIYITGEFASSSITFDTITLPNSTGGKVFVAKYNPSGNVFWAVAAGGYVNGGTSYFDYGRSITVDKNKDVYHVGYLNSTQMNFDPTILYLGGAFIAKLDQCQLLFDSIPQSETVCLGGSVTFTVKAKSIDTVNYQWLFNGDTIPSAIDSFYTISFVSYADTGSYSCVINNFCGVDISPVAKLEVSIPPADAGNDVSVCDGNTATLTASGGDSYIWNTTETSQSITVAPLIDVTYTVIVTDSIGCTDTDDVTVTVTDLPTAEAGANQIICSGETAILTASGGTAYQWNTTSTGAIINVTPAITATYTVTVDDNGCTDSDEVTVNVYLLPAIEILGSISVCEGKDTTLKATGGISYLWNTGATIDSIVISPLTSMTYTVTGIDNNNCTNTDEIVITINDVPVVDLGIDTCIESGKIMILDAGAGYTYAWQDNSTAQTYIVTTQGDYWVMVTNDCGTESDTIDIILCPTSALYVPNGFTPNGDTRNDKFMPVALNITEFEMHIYDRWGQDIFHTTDVNEGWNGKCQGKLCPLGVYVYFISYKDVDSSEKKKKYGHVNLLR